MRSLVLRRWSLATLLCASITAASATLPAQTDDQRASARAAAQAGLEAFDAQKWPEVLDLFTRAEGMLHAPIHVYYIGLAQLKLGHLVAAREAFLRLSNEAIAPTAPKAFRDAQANAAKELPGLEPRIPSLKITATPAPKGLGFTIDGAELPGAIVGIPTSLDPGVHRIVAHGEGMASDPVTVTLKEGAKEAITITLHPVATSVAVPSASAMPTSSPPPLASSAPPPPSSPGPAAPPSSLRVPAYAALGVGGVGLVLGTVFAVRSHGQHADAENACPGGRCPVADRAKIDGFSASATSSGRLAAVSFAVGGVGVATGVALLLLGGHAPAESARLTPMFTFDSVGLRGTF